MRYMQSHLEAVALGVMPSLQRQMTTRLKQARLPVLHCCSAQFKIQGLALADVTLHEHFTSRTCYIVTSSDGLDHGLQPWTNVVERLRSMTVAVCMQGWVIMYAVSQFVFGFGIGGEYPMTSTRATEETEVGRKRGQRHRGRKVMLAYTMQASGALSRLLLGGFLLWGCMI